jgi:hypothetical protein
LPADWDLRPSCTPRQPRYKYADAIEIDRSEEVNAMSEAQRQEHDQAEVLATEVALVASIRTYEETLAASLDALRAEGDGVTVQAEQRAEERAFRIAEAAREAEFKGAYKRAHEAGLDGPRVVAGAVTH